MFCLSKKKQKKTVGLGLAVQYELGYAYSCYFPHLKDKSLNSTHVGLNGDCWVELSTKEEDNLRMCCSLS